MAPQTSVERKMLVELKRQAVASALLHGVICNETTIPERLLPQGYRGTRPSPLCLAPSQPSATAHQNTTADVMAANANRWNALSARLVQESHEDMLERTFVTRQPVTAIATHPDHLPDLIDSRAHPNEPSAESTASDVPAPTDHGDGMPLLHTLRELSLARQPTRGLNRQRAMQDASPRPTSPVHTAVPAQHWETIRIRETFTRTVPSSYFAPNQADDFDLERSQTVDEIAASSNTSSEAKRVLEKLNADECPMCHEKYTPPLVFTTCGHVFCKDCVVPVMQSRNECPFCLKPHRLRELTKIEHEAS
ncbi:hypothetical protein M409DRAFT_22206 [Zasmidium cellare ATCC 36951]|uniref:RING-type domain-containing protein n=1 Tax=Zasmidium cellare ATCC 36951 TaxID=1080233 RepID=A0A6A6CJR2_ZASCE|nr:uncharacterized protein M409DRAFT_22206 [Zasmidium cellare ATCC 36951]KAF2167395.1 hypothetical protein M409DRAFT_22206 [Zasmidium cellare ATCC 36951]